jgi:predicted DsbA family dithiol-disulfide isomerase
MSNNNMMCDLETGVCGVIDGDTIQEIDFNLVEKKITLYYVTDPICSHCWALEPVLNSFIAQYSQYFNIQVIMGGLLASWEGFSDGANGIQQPSDVTKHWQEVGQHSRMPIDGSLWLNNPILSSYPPSRVYKVIESKKEGKEHEFLRRAREAVFVFNRNIGEEEVLIDLVNQLNLHGPEIVEGALQQSAQELLEQDFEMSASLGFRGFPTIIMVNEDNKGVKIVGARSLETYIDALQKISKEQIQAKKVPSLRELLQHNNRLFSKEIEVMYGIEASEVQTFIKTKLPESEYYIQSIMNELYIELV